MKTKKLRVLFPVFFTLVAMHISCNSVGIAQDQKPIISRNTYIDIQRIKSKDKGQICVKLDPITQCGQPVKCGTGDYINKNGIPVEKLFGANYIEVPGSPCNSFTADLPGNTRYYCSGGYCYAY